MSILRILFVSLLVSILFVSIDSSNNSNKLSKTIKPSSKSTSKKVDLRSKRTTNNTNKQIKSANLLIPKLLPHPDTCYLLEFHHDDCDHAEQMEPVLKRLEDDLDTKVRRININTRKEFLSLLSTVGHDECGSFPFYYNRRTGQAICGATSYSNLRSWGTGEIGHMFHEPPENMHDQEGRGAVPKHEVGFKGFFAEKMKRQPRRSPADKSKQTKQVNPGKQTKESASASAKTGTNDKVGEPVGAKKTKGVAAARMEERQARRESKRKLASASK